MGATFLTDVIPLVPLIAVLLLFAVKIIALLVRNEHAKRRQFACGTSSGDKTPIIVLFEKDIDLRSGLYAGPFGVSYAHVALK